MESWSFPANRLEGLEGDQQEGQAARISGGGILPRCMRARGLAEASQDDSQNPRLGGGCVSAPASANPGGSSNTPRLRDTRLNHCWTARLTMDGTRALMAALQLRAVLLVINGITWECCSSVF